MTEPPRPPGEGNANDPTRPFNPYAANDPASGSTPPPPPPYGTPSSGSGYGAPQPPASGPGYGAPPPTSGPGYGEPPVSGPGGYGGPPPGYGTPPPQYGYQQPGFGASPAQDDKTWILVAHFGGALGAFLGGGLGGWIAPLIALLAKGNQSPVVRAESVKALNFQIVWSIVGIIGWATACLVIGFVIIPIAALIAIIFGVIAGLKALNNEPYKYPMTINLIK
ncbi:DUF4870 domain-containing protein [Actinoplanes sp. M2I2]|uniref:DUF4870 domain-containing protein n=1 Tax=Actinoplanes sp. M2I2 TaxID=1734444 RepID=UPI0020210544|nr:DUF4870 domain-containing protein [Actinoplanes sp. M2I2]